LFSVTAGSFNTAVGAGSLDLNTADSNTATGAAALLFNTTGTENTANGTAALEINETGSQNTATGAFALFNNTTGEGNTASGDRALFSNGAGATGDGNLPLGSFNSAFGSLALMSNTDGTANSAFGWSALVSNTTGSSNTATGFQALGDNTIGIFSTASGDSALRHNTTGNDNTAIGHSALFNNTTGILNVALGANAGGNVITANNVICVGASLPGANVSNTCFIGNIRGVTTQNANAIPVLIDTAGQLGTMSSSRRFKREIKAMDQASEAILALKPVTFHYKSDDTSTPQFGLIAEDVAEVDPDLVVRDQNGDIYTVRYDAVNAMLLNEFLKEHRKLQEQEATIALLKSTDEKREATTAKQQKQIEALTAGLQKVSAQLELNKPAPQTVQNSQ